MLHGSLGTFSGTVAIAIFTFGIVAKMLFESIETIDIYQLPTIRPVILSQYCTLAFPLFAHIEM